MSFPDFTFWSHLLATIGVEVCCLAALGLVARYFVRSAVWQRAIWQTTVVCLLLLPLSEWTGFGRGAAAFLFGRKPVVEIAPTTGFTVFKSGVARAPSLVELNPPPAQSPPAVWWPAWIWLAGAALVLGRMAAAQLLLLALRLRREKIINPSLRQRVACIARSVGLRRKVSLLWMPESISPMAFGIVRPSIGLPPGFEAKLSMTEQDAVLAHELAHLAAMDPLWFLLADFASVWLWWHPLMWWARHSLHGAAELAADEATSIVPDGPAALANCLVSLGKEMTAARGWSWVGINGGFRSSLGKRVERLMQMPGGARRPLAGWAGAAAKFVATMVVVPSIVLLCGSFQSAHAQKAENWKSQLRQSWNDSPGALLLLAALDNEPKQNADIATRVQNGKVLYEKGKLDESEALLVSVRNQDPANRAAAYYLDLIKEARYMERSRQLEEGTKNLPLPSFHTNLVYTTKGRQDILAKLDSIVLEKVNYNLPLKDVLLQLRNESRKRDPDGTGVNFMIDNGAYAVADATPQVDAGQVRIKISPPLRNLRLADVLDAVTMVADSPIRYTVEDYGVVFSHVPRETVPGLDLHTKLFRLDRDTFVHGLEIATGVTLNRTNRTAGAHQLVVAYFASVGVDFAPPKAIFFNDRLGELLVRTTLQDLDIIQHAVETLNQTPPRVKIEARFVEVDEAALQGLALDWSKSAPDITGPKTDPSFRAAPSASARAFTGIMTDKQFRPTLAAIENRFGADVLDSPKFKVESGTQSHFDSSNGHEGLALDVLPLIGPDGYHIQITAVLFTPNVTAERGTQAHPDSSNRIRGLPVEIIPIGGTNGYPTQISAVPTFKSDDQTWQVGASRNVFDGETMVIGGEIANQPSGSRKVRLVFLIPTIIDPVGNPLHTDDQLSKSLELLNP